MPTAHNNSIGFSISGSVNGGGIKHFTNWDAGLTSIEFDQKEKFINKEATSFLTEYTFYDQLGEPLKIKYGADNVKIVDNYAAVSYPEYTDLVKSSFYFIDSHVFSEGMDGILPTNHVYIPIFRFNELNRLLISQFGSNNINLKEKLAVDLDGSFIVLHYHDDSLYAGAVEPQILKYVSPYTDDGTKRSLAVGEFTLAVLNADGTICLDFNNGCQNYSVGEIVVVANIGSETKTIEHTDEYYTPNCCGMVGPPPPPPPCPGPGCTGATGLNTTRCSSTACCAYWTNYIGEGESRYIGLSVDLSQIDPETDNLFFDLNEYSGGLSLTGIVMDETLNPGYDSQMLDHWYVADIPILTGLGQSYELLQFSMSTPPGIYYLTGHIYNQCQTGEWDTIPIILQVTDGGGVISESVPLLPEIKSNEKLFGTDPRIRGSIPCDIEFIKYKPIIGCGKVDIYYINKGVITDYTNQIATCTDHHLKSGDIIRIFGVLGMGNGSFYVDPINDDTFNIYLQYVDGNFIDKINLNVTENVQFIKIGNVLDANETTWQFHSSLTSPRGRNGYGALLDGETSPEDIFDQQKIYWCSNKNKLSDCFNGMSNFSEIFSVDYGLDFAQGEFDEAQKSPLDRLSSITLNTPKLTSVERWIKDITGPGGNYKNPDTWFNNLIPTKQININTAKDYATNFPNDDFASIDPRTRNDICDLYVQARSPYGIYDIWNTAYTLINNFKFGCSIDLKKDEINNLYYLLVGESGLDTVLTTDRYYQLPQYGHGAAYLFRISTYPDDTSLVSETIPSSVILEKYYAAHIGDSEIGEPEPLVYTGPFPTHIDTRIVDNIYGFGATRDFSFDMFWSNHTTYRVHPELRSFPNCAFNFIAFPDSDTPDYLTMRGDRVPFRHPLFLGDCSVLAASFGLEWGNIERKTDHAYWYGSMLYSLANIKNGISIYDKYDLNPTFENPQNLYFPGIYPIHTADTISCPPYNENYLLPNSCINAYFSNLPIVTIPAYNFASCLMQDIMQNQTYHYPYLNFSHPFDSNAASPWYLIYPYVDNFGKSVALDISEDGIFVFASSRTKPIINRPQSTFDYNTAYWMDQSYFDAYNACESNTDLSASYVGYIHVFNGETKINKIYETEAIIFPSKRWQSSYYKADKFAICMYADKGQLFWGQTKGIELLTEDQTWTNEVSKIFIYERQKLVNPNNPLIFNFVYNKSKTIENYNDRHISYLINVENVPDHKEYRLRNLLNNFTFSDPNSPFTFYPSDRFGSCFKVDKNILVTNAFDNQNELGVLHSAENSDPETTPALVNHDYNKTLDYLHVYLLFNNEWRYVQKIAPSFNKNNVFYDYDSILFPSVKNSIRNLANITYDNSIENSRTWDIDLTNSFIVADNRIILKDPISYSIFEEDFSIVKNNTSILNLPVIQDLTVNALQYFTYDEELSIEVIPSNEDCNELVFNNLNGLYTFNYQPEDYKDIVYQNQIVNDNKYLNIKTPVYFISLPKVDDEFININNITFTVEEIIASSSSFNSGNNRPSILKMVIFTKDPRTTIYPIYLDYFNLCNINTTTNKVHAKYVPEIINYLYRGGALDSYQYTENSFANNINTFSLCSDNLCLAKTFEPTLTTGDGLHKIHQFVITKEMFDLSSLLIKGDLLLNASDNRSFTNNGVTDILEFNDLEKYGYDSSIPVENTLIIGFIFDLNKSYTINNDSVDYNSGIRINTIESSIKYNFSSEPSFIDNNGASLRKFKCILNKVYNFDYITSNSICFSNQHNLYNYSYSYEQILQYRKPVLGIGSSHIGLHQTRSEIYDGAITKTLEIISLDNIDQVNSTLASIYTRHFSIQPLEYLSLFINGYSRFPYKDTTLHINGPLQTTSNFDLLIKANEPSVKDTTLHLLGPVPLFNDLSLHMHGHRICTTPYLDHPYLFIRCTYVDNNDIPLHMLGFKPESMSLFTKGPIKETLDSTLFIKSLQYNNDIPLYILAKDSSNNNTILFLQNQVIINALPLNIAGPIPFNSGINSDNNLCQITNRDILFDISNNAENEIDDTNTNSICLNKYENKANKLNYASKDIVNITLGNNELADNDFYSKYRDNKSIAANDNYLCVATNVDLTSSEAISYWSGKHIPSVEIFELNNDTQANLIFVYNNLFNDLIAHLPDLVNINTNFIDANIISIDISNDNKIAVSFNVSVRRILDESLVTYISCIVILHPNGANQWNSVKIIEQYVDANLGNSLDIMTGIHLQWANRDLYYSENNINPISDCIKIAKFNSLTDTYSIESTLITFTATNLYSSYFMVNMQNEFLPNIHYGFGHKFIVHDDLMFVSAPLVDPFWSNNITYSNVSNSHCGVVFVFKLVDGLWEHSNTIYNDGYLTLNDATDRSGSFIQRLFGYDLDYNASLKILIVSQPLTQNIYKFKINDDTIILDNSLYKNETAYGNHIAICNSQIISLSKKDNGILYYNSNTDQFTFDSSLIDDELLEYQTGVISSYNEKIINFKIVNVNNHEYILALRKFNIIYSDSSNNVIQKISLLNLDHLINGTLFIKSPEPSNKSLSHFIAGPIPNNTDIRLFTYGLGTSKQLTTLYIGNIVRVISPLFLKTIDPLRKNNNTILFIRSSSIPGSIFNVKQANFFIKGRIFSRDFTKNAPLFLQSPSKDYVNNSMTLQIGIVPISKNNNVSLFNYGSLSPSIAIDQILNTNTTLFVCSRGYLKDYNAPLFMQTKSGGEKLNLTLWSQSQVNNFTLFTNATYGINKNISLILFSKDSNLGINTFIRGYRS